MPLLPDLLKLLGRPDRVEGGAAARRKAPSEPALPTPQPATEAELEAALVRIAQERQDAEAAIERAGQRRETLLMVPDSDAEILGARDEIDRQQLLLERLDRIGPEVRQRLRLLQLDARRRRWIELRDGYLRAGRVYLDAAREFEAAHHSALHEARQAIVREFADADHIRGVNGIVTSILPAPPLLPRASLDEFDAKMAKFAWVQHDPDPAPIVHFRVASELAEAELENLGISVAPTPLELAQRGGRKSAQEPTQPEEAA